MKLIPVMIFLVLVSTVVPVFAESVSFIKSQYSDEELEQCEIRVDSETLHIPIRYELEFDELPDKNSLTVITQSDLQFERQPNGFNFSTETVDRHDITLKLDYKDDEPKVREVYYRIYSNNNPVAEGTWKHDSNQFCKTFHFFAQEPPIIYDTKYFEEQFLIVEGKKLQIIIDKQVEAESFNVIMGVLGMIGAIGAGVMGIYVYINFQDVSRTLAKPVKKINESVAYFRKVTENSNLILTKTEYEVEQAVLQVITEARYLKEESEKLVNIGSKFQKKADEKIVVPSAKNLVYPKTPIETKTDKPTMKPFIDSEGVKKLEEYSKNPLGMILEKLKITKPDAVVETKTVIRDEVTIDTSEKTKPYSKFVTDFFEKVPIVNRLIDDKLPEDEKELSKLMVKWERKDLMETYLSLHERITGKDSDKLTDLERLQYKLSYEILRMKK